MKVVRRPAGRRFRSWGVILPVLLSGAFAGNASAAVITVSTQADDVANDGHCALREAVTAANTDTASGLAAGECNAGAGADTIRFGVAHPTLTRAGVGE